MINVTSAHDHVGTLLTDSKWDVIKYMKQRIDACKKPAFAITSIGSSVAPMTPISASKLYWSICVPKITYGLHLMQMPDESISHMESFHATMAKTYQGLPDQACSIGAVAGVGWLSLKSYVDMNILKYFMRIIRLPTSNVYKKLFIIRYCHHMYNDSGKHHGPVSAFLTVCREHDLLGDVKQAVEECAIPSGNAWKSKVSKLIWHSDNRHWNIVNKLYKSLVIVNKILPCIKMLGWWQYVQTRPMDTRRCRVAIRLLYDCHGLKSCRFKYKNASDPYCEKCGNMAVEDPEHIMWYCDANIEIRQAMWDSIQVVSPPALYESMVNMDICDRTVFFLSGMMNTFTHEWSETLHTMLEFIERLYHSHCAAHSS